jgi:hypothetical protein
MTMADRELTTDRGASLVEAAFMLPLIVLILFGIVQFAILYDRQQGLHAAAREGARLASLPTTTQTEITDRVNDALEGVSLPGGITITVTPGDPRPCEGRHGETVVVEIENSSQLNIPLFPNRTITLDGRGEFRCE